MLFKKNLQRNTYFHCAQYNCIPNTIILCAVKIYGLLKLSFGDVVNSSTVNVVTLMIFRMVGHWTFKPVPLFIISL